MRLAFCAESEPDRDVVHAIIERILERRIEVASSSRVRLGGIDKAIQLAPIVARTAYTQGLDGAVFVIDNDGKPPHAGDHDATPNPDCRLCRLRTAASLNDPSSWPRPGLSPLAFLFAVPVQAIETWLLLMTGYVFKGAPETLGTDASGRRRLKSLLYGTETPDQLLRDKKSRAALERFDANQLATRSESFRQFRDQIVAIRSESPASASAAASGNS